MMRARIMKFAVSCVASCAVDCSRLRLVACCTCLANCGCLAWSLVCIPRALLCSFELETSDVVLG